MRKTIVAVVALGAVLSAPATAAQATSPKQRAAAHICKQLPYNTGVSYRHPWHGKDCPFKPHRSRKPRG